jgi:hypothetical protein
VLLVLKLIHEVGVVEQPITSFNWNAEKLGLAASTSFDQPLRIIPGFLNIK